MTASSPDVRAWRLAGLGWLALLLPGPGLAGEDAVLPGTPRTALERAARDSLPAAGAVTADVGGARRWQPARDIALTLLPVSFPPAAPSFPNQQRWCGIAVQAGEAALTTLVTLGTGWTETLSCDGLREAGTVPPAAGVPRFALVYAARSPNTAVRVPVILRWDAPSGRVKLDEAASRAVDEAGRGGSLERIRVALRSR